MLYDASPLFFIIFPQSAHQDGGLEPTEKLQCRYFDEDAEEWSTEGCVTAALDGSDNVGCQCTHLSDFIAVKVPVVDGEDDIEFASFDLDSEICLHCSCTKGVTMRLYKDESHPSDGGNWTSVLDVAVPVTLDDGVEAPPFLWRVLDVAYGGRSVNDTIGGRNTSVDWLHLPYANGTVEEQNLRLELDPTGLEETPFADGYQAIITLEVYDGTGTNKTTTIDVLIAVTSTTKAPLSVWGAGVDELAAPGTACTHDDMLTTTGTPISITLGEPTKLPFAACDADALPVTHRLPRVEIRNAQPADPREFSASMSRDAGLAYEGYEPELLVFYASVGRYYLLVDTEAGLGEHEVVVYLDGEPIMQPLTVNVVCPAGLIAIQPENITCGCPAGYEDAPLGSDVPCTACDAGMFKDGAGNYPCVACGQGTYYADAGAISCLDCEAGKYVAGTGAIECESCGGGTSSDAGSSWCYECPAGTYAEGGEPACVPCKRGTANNIEAQSECKNCFPDMYAGEGFTECRKCGMYDKMQETAKQGDGVMCDYGFLNGTLPGYWAAEPLTLDSGNWTKVWKCKTHSVCLGGYENTCLQGHTGPLCDVCIENWYLDSSDNHCHDCGDSTPWTDVEKFLFVVLVILGGLGCGVAMNTLFFKSDAVDRWANFFYRVRTNPMLAAAQIIAIRNVRQFIEARSLDSS